MDPLDKHLHQKHIDFQELIKKPPKPASLEPMSRRPKKNLGPIIKYEEIDKNMILPTEKKDKT